MQQNKKRLTCFKVQHESFILDFFLSEYVHVFFFAWLFPTTCHGLSRHNGEYGKRSHDSN